MFNGSSTAIWPRFVCIEYINTFALNDIQTVFFLKHQIPWSQLHIKCQEMQYSNLVWLMLILHLAIKKYLHNVNILQAGHFLLAQEIPLTRKIVWIYYPARARSTRARRACALRALGLLLADGTPTVGGGKTFWAVSQIFLRKQL